MKTEKNKLSITQKTAILAFVMIVLFIGSLLIYKVYQEKPIESRIRVEQNVTVEEHCMGYEKILEELDPFPYFFKGYQLETIGYVDNYNVYKETIYGTFSQIDSCKCIEYSRAEGKLLELIKLRDKTCQE